MLSRVDLASADLAGPVRQQLRAWCDRPAEHARFLNTLSLLEHIGSRKIMVSQTRGPLSCEVLKHLSEEARHAFFFKRLAEKVAGRVLDFSPANTLGLGAAQMYFGRLDAGIARALQPNDEAETPYLYVSMVIELRAIWAYRLYHQALTESGTGLSLKSILAEEELHLPQMADRLVELGEDIERRLDDFVPLEDRLFRRLWHAFVAASEPAAAASAA
jgi:hypothetical protein